MFLCFKLLCNQYTNDKSNECQHIIWFRSARQERDVCVSFIINCFLVLGTEQLNHFVNRRQPTPKCLVGNAFVSVQLTKTVIEKKTDGSKLDFGVDWLASCELDEQPHWDLYYEASWIIFSSKILSRFLLINLLYEHFLLVLINLKRKCRTITIISTQEFIKPQHIWWLYHDY